MPGGLSLLHHGWDANPTRYLHLGRERHLLCLVIFIAYTAFLETTVGRRNDQCWIVENVGKIKRPERLSSTFPNFGKLECTFC